MKKSALSLIILWAGVLAITCWVAISIYSSGGFRVPNSWQFLFISALLAPGIAYAVINPLISHTEGRNNAIVDFINLNLLQLKTYMVGIFLTIVVVGVVVVIMAALWGLLLNSFLLISNLFSNKS
jgi:hypothetical protein